MGGLEVEVLLAQGGQLLYLGHPVVGDARACVDPELDRHSRGRQVERRHLADDDAAIVDACSRVETRSCRNQSRDRERLGAEVVIEDVDADEIEADDEDPEERDQPHQQSSHSRPPSRSRVIARAPEPVTESLGSTFGAKSPGGSMTFATTPTCR